MRLSDRCISFSAISSESATLLFLQYLTTYRLRINPSTCLTVGYDNAVRRLITSWLLKIIDISYTDTRKNSINLFEQRISFSRSKETKETTGYPVFLARLEETVKEDPRDLLDLLEHPLKGNTFRFQDLQVLPGHLVRPGCLWSDRKENPALAETLTEKEIYTMASGKVRILRSSIWSWWLCYGVIKLNFAFACRKDREAAWTSWKPCVNSSSWKNWKNN